MCRVGARMGADPHPGVHTEGHPAVETHHVTICNRSRYARQSAYYCGTIDKAEHFIDAILRSRLQQAHGHEDDDDDDLKLYHDMTLEDFIKFADDEKECMNLLDLPNYQPDVPIFIRQAP